MEGHVPDYSHTLARLSRLPDWQPCYAGFVDPALKELYRCYSDRIVEEGPRDWQFVGKVDERGIVSVAEALGPRRGRYPGPRVAASDMSSTELQRAREALQNRADRCVIQGCKVRHERTLPGYKPFTWEDAERISGGEDPRWW